MNTKLTIKILLLAVITSFCMYCDDYEAEEYTPSAFDRMVVALMSDSSAVIAVVPEALTNFDTTWVGPNIADNVPAILDTLGLHQQELLPQDSCYQIDVSTGDTLYFSIAISQTGEYSFCFDEPIIINLLDNDGSVIAVSSEKWPIEEVASGISYYTDENYKQTLTYNLVVKNTYNLSAGSYLGQFIMTEMMTESVLKTVIKMAM